MLGTANIKVRPLKLALLVDPNSASQFEAIRFACSLEPNGSARVRKGAQAVGRRGTPFA